MIRLYQRLVDAVFHATFGAQGRRHARRRRAWVWVTHSGSRLALVALTGVGVLAVAVVGSIGHEVWKGWTHVEAARGRVAVAATTPASPGAPAGDITDDADDEATGQQRAAVETAASQFVVGLIAGRTAMDPQERANAVAGYSGLDVQMQVAESDPATIPNSSVTNSKATEASSNQAAVTVSLANGASVEVAVVSDGAQWQVIDWQVAA